MTTLVYPVGHGRGDLLRYSLRSVAYAAPATLPDIVIVGECPDYIDPAAVTFIESSQARSPFHNVWLAWQRTASALGADAEWWWMNDDFFVTAPTLDVALIDAHRGPLDAFLTALEGRPGVGPWRKRAWAASGLLRAQGFEDIMCWEAHRPMRACGGDVVRAVAALNRFNMSGPEVAHRTLIATVGRREGVAMADPKTDERTCGPIDDPLASVGPRAWAGPIGERLRSWFPYPSPWERS